MHLDNLGIILAKVSCYTICCYTVVIQLVKLRRFPLPRTLTYRPWFSLVYNKIIITQNET